MGRRPNVPCSPTGVRGESVQGKEFDSGVAWNLWACSLALVRQVTQMSVFWCTRHTWYLVVATENIYSIHTATTAMVGRIYVRFAYYIPGFVYRCWSVWLANTIRYIYTPCIYIHTYNIDIRYRYITPEYIYIYIGQFIRSRVVMLKLYRNRLPGIIYSDIST